MLGHRKIDDGSYEGETTGPLFAGSIGDMNKPYDMVKRVDDKVKWMATATRKGRLIFM